MICRKRKGLKKTVSVQYSLAYYHTLRNVDFFSHSCSNYTRHSKNMDFNKWNIFWSFLFGLLSATIFVGNSLVIRLLLKRTLRKRPHFLLISLAVADMLVGLLAIPIYMVTVITQQKLISTVVFDCVDMFTGFASIYTIATISLERMYAIVAPLRHRQIAFRCYTFAITTPWVVSIMVASTRLLLAFHILTRPQFINIVIFSLSTPLLLTVVAYSFIWCKQSPRRRNSPRFRARRDARLSKTVLLVTTCFYATWLPFQVLIIVLNWCFPCRRVSFGVVLVIKLIQFSNSVINFIIYCLRMPKYRQALARIFCSNKRSCVCAKYQENPWIASFKSTVSLVSFTRTFRQHSKDQGFD